ncbi:MAG TPA: type IV secretory system conjugative DNA transfer family protein [Acidimicrobiales bacterium]|nr:type IV secretory system conjugative DNA transfer family protein [Acidimicrobiales bacterium]
MAALIALVAVAGLAWCGAALAAMLAGRGRFHASLADALRAACGMPGHFGDPAAAWPEPIRSALPGPVPYWLAHFVVVAVLVVVAVVAWRVLRTPPERDGLGVERSAAFANRGDLARLLVKGPTPGRIILGRAEGGLVATEQRTGVCIIGPSQSGKTTGLCVPALLELGRGGGAVLASSIKEDLWKATQRRRNALGDVKVFDPTLIVSRRSDTWSPLRQAHGVSGAQAAARALAEVAGKSNLENPDFWMNTSKELLWPLFFIAANTDGAMRDVVRWVTLHDRPIIGGNGRLVREGEVSERLRFLMDHARPDDPDATPPFGTPPVRIDEPKRRPFPTVSEVALARDAMAGTWGSDERLRSGIYSSARTVIEAWSDPVVASASDGCEITPEWLLAGNNTLYIVAPAKEQAQFRPVFTSLVADLVHQAFDTATRNGGELKHKLLVLLDEAANICPARELPSWCSTAPSHGITLVTVWQDRSQQRARYGRDGAETVWNNSAAKVILSGLADHATAEVTQLLGEEEYQRTGSSVEVGTGRRSVNQQAYSRRLVSEDSLRRQAYGQALLIYKELPPARLTLRPWKLDPALRALQEGRDGWSALRRLVTQWWEQLDRHLPDAPRRVS